MRYKDVMGRALPLAPGTAPPRATPDPNFTNYSSDDLAQMVSMRLRSARESYFRHWHFHKVGEKVVILVIPNVSGEHVVLEDDFSLFPSDALITALRLLEK